MNEKLIELTAIIHEFVSMQILREMKQRIGRKPVTTTKSTINELALYLIDKGVTIPVRCSECKWHLNEDCLKLRVFVNRDGVRVFTKDNFFCAYGERKESEE